MSQKRQAGVPKNAPGLAGLSFSRPTRRVLQFGLVSGLVVVSAAGFSSKQASASAAYSATASSAALRMDVRDPKVVPVLDGGGTESTSPSAQATADSLGQSRAVSAVVYPGNDASGATDIPLTVVADAGHPRPADMNSGGYQLSATAPEGQAHASANGGLDGTVTPAGSVAAKADVAPTKSGGVAAEATNAVTGLKVMTVLQLGTVTSRATAERSSTGVLKVSSNLTITGASILGLPLQLVDGQLVVPVLGATVPVGQAIASNPALAAVKERGLTVSFQAAKTTPNGIVAPGIQVTMVTATPALPIPTVPLPDGVPVGVGAIPPSTATTVIAIGFARASSNLQPIADFVGDSGSTPVLDPPAVGSTTGGSTTSAPLGTSTSPSTGATDPVSVPAVAVPGADPGLAPDVAQPTTTAPALRSATRLITPFQGTDIYLAIVAAALTITAAAQLIRFQGVRTR
jgi:hypothetical protein